MSRILIVEDEPIIRSALRRLLERNSYTVDDAGSVDEATNQFNLNDYNLIISDLRLPGAPGTDLIDLAKAVPVVIMTSYASMRSAVEAMKMGAVDYIAKPFDHDEILETIANIIKLRSDDDTAATPKNSARPNSSNEMVGNCPAMQNLFSRIQKVAGTDATVLIQGESGTGKELAARAIHQQSARASSPMVSVNCASIPESLIESELFGHEKGAFTGADATRNGLIEAAHGGTLFLDEIGELPLEAQARLLRFLQESEIRRVGSVKSIKVDVRLIAATHRNLKALAKTGEFREDLYYRLYVMELQMPPLRERGEDIIEIAQQFLQRSCDKLGSPLLKFSDDACTTMIRYNWPGNVRELQNAIERAVILADDHMITTDLLGLDIEPDSLAELESSFASGNSLIGDTGFKERRADQNLSLDDYFQRFVLENQDNMSETKLAKKLGVSRKCLWERRQKLGIPRKPKE
ncbi:sigma-54 dependent transcriptional regulator [Amphritea sp. 2_MG-2023]|uniref:sigma-54-dependent transcriptional regulator n=1 Tax=Amphritea TaxID=515417 RepID=UPI001C0777CA|nr:MULTISPECIES: sigma-54 dependent transcriptional regulator [Amphritea]MBU2966858.1 sigma-54 dependent transcriptional regulator [Amphritea atlantica]MDO6420074.1 sigma-54 dependent transcriptional regulator [Amphritea sp. 2_MG-2023]